MTSTNSRSRTFTAGTVTAAIAALVLTACGPHDTTDPGAFAGGAPATAAQAAPTTPVGATANDPTIPTASAIDRSGTPVPSTTVAPTPVAMAPAYPQDPARVAQAPVGYPVQSESRVAPPPVYLPAPEPRRVADARAVDRNNIGSVTSIEPIRNRPQGSGAGAVIGGVLGAVVGNQFGHSGGRAAMTGLGAVGGALAGNNIERNHREGITGYRVSIRLDNGNTRTYERSDVGNLQVGDRVHLDANSFHRV